MEAGIVNLRDLPRRPSTVAPLRMVYYRTTALAPIKPLRTFAFHYVMEGEGVLERGGKARPLGPNDVFALRPGHDFTMSSRRPWKVMALDYAPEHAAAPFPGEPCWQARDPVAARTLVEALAHYAAHAEIPGNADLLDLLAAALMAECARKGAEPERHDPLRRVVEHIQTNYRRDIPPSELIRLSGLSRSHFFRLWKQGRAMAPAEYLHRVRMKKALELLLEPELRIKEVAAAVGYDDPYYFTYKFKKLIGMSPKAYRENR